MERKSRFLKTHRASWRRTEGTLKSLVEGKKGSHATIEDAVRVRKVLDAIQKSLSTGERVTVTRQ
ncbi:hypothetical protein BKA70DRAFT_1254923 [Coprinopsis sp. MPI-PUGE-AT-0042]|nr:hypothetical protein BKA70DRAFT_1254923 [Coprinopsis sp. MPI-PUGE-AT-0042]